MKLHRSGTDETFRISGYGDGYVVIAEQRVESSFALHAGQLHAFEDLRDLETLGWERLRFLHDTPPELLVLGTGKVQRFPQHRLYTEFASRRIGLEVMSTPAACRTYNILGAEGRNVSALMLMVRDPSGC